MEGALSIETPCGWGNQGLQGNASASLSRDLENASGQMPA
jgi:hypothetical protein